MKKIKAAILDEKFATAQEDVLEHFDMARMVKIHAAAPAKPKRVQVDFPPWMVGLLDKEAIRLGVTRQALIKIWLSERLAQH